MTPLSPLPWYVAGPLIGLIVPALLVVGGKVFGLSANLRHACAALPIPARVEESTLGAIEDLLTSAKSKAEGTVMPTMVVVAGPPGPPSGRPRARLLTTNHSR